MEVINHELLSLKFRNTGLSYEKLARETDLRRGTLHNVMFGITRPSYQVTCRLASALFLTKQEIIDIFFPHLKFEKEHSRHE